MLTQAKSRMMRPYLLLTLALGLSLGIGLTASVTLAGRLVGAAVATERALAPSIPDAKSRPDGPTGRWRINTILMLMALVIGGLLLWGRPVGARSQVSLVIPITTSTSTPTPTPTCELAWHIVPGPDLAGAPYHLNGVAAVSANDVWAVGSYRNGSVYQTLITHWNGAEWSVVSSPNVLTYTNELQRVAVVSRTDIWAVGYYDYENYFNSPRGALIEHWDGTQWSVFGGERPGSYNDLAVISADDVWLVGYHCDTGACQPLVAHWDGQILSEVPTPPCMLYPFVSKLNGISAVSPNDIWAVGYCGHEMLTEHWDGTKWSVVPNGIRGRLLEVLAVSPNDVWGLRQYNEELSPEAPAGFAGTVHWDGVQWSMIPGQGGDGTYNGIAAASTNDVWAVGGIGDTRQTRVEHWDGAQWNLVPQPGLRYCYFSSSDRLNDVAIVSGSDIWAVGGYGQTAGGSGGEGLFMHYTTCPKASTELVGHVTWQGRPTEPNTLQQLPITLTLTSNTTEIDYTDLSTDASGVFTVPISTLAEGFYNWRAKGPKFLANVGTVVLTSAPATHLEVGLMLSGDCDGNDVVNATDFSILRNTFGKALGDPGYDDRADLTGDNVVNAADFILLRTNFGFAGALPITCD